MRSYSYWSTHHRCIMEVGAYDSDDQQACFIPRLHDEAGSTSWLYERSSCARRALVELVDRDRVEVAQEARRDRVASAAWRSHRRHQLDTIQYNILLLQSQTDRCDSDVHNDMYDIPRLHDEAGSTSARRAIDEQLRECLQYYTIQMTRYPAHQTSSTSTRRAGSTSARRALYERS